MRLAGRSYFSAYNYGVDIGAGLHLQVQGLFYDMPRQPAKGNAPVTMEIRSFLYFPSFHIFSLGIIGLSLIHI